MPLPEAAIADAVLLAMEALVGPLIERVATLEESLMAAGVTSGQLTYDVTGLRERVAVLEVKAPVPGPPGVDGTDGADGLGIHDLSVDFDGERTLALTFMRDGVTKVFPVELSGYPLYRGVYAEGKPYVSGDRVTWAGSEWHCQAATTSKPGNGAKAWTLCVKCGRDGKDGRDGRDLAPVVKAGT